MADCARRNVDGKVTVQGGVESRPFFGFGPAFIADIALAIVGTTVPCGRHECSYKIAEKKSNQYCLHCGKCAELCY